MLSQVVTLCFLHRNRIDCSSPLTSVYGTAPQVPEALHGWVREESLDSRKKNVALNRYHGKMGLCQRAPIF